MELSSRSIWSNESDGADRIAFKFGLYGINLNKSKNQKAVRIYFSKVGTAKSCKAVGIESCDKLMKLLDVVGTSGALGVFRFDMKQKTEF